MGDGTESGNGSPYGLDPKLLETLKTFSTFKAVTSGRKEFSGVAVDALEEYEATHGGEHWQKVLADPDGRQSVASYAPIFAEYFNEKIGGLTVGQGLSFVRSMGYNPETSENLPEDANINTLRLAVRELKRKIEDSTDKGEEYKLTPEENKNKNAYALWQTVLDTGLQHGAVDLQSRFAKKQADLTDKLLSGEISLDMLGLNR